MEFPCEDEPDLTIPENTVARARLEKLDHHTFDWTDRQTGEMKTSSKLVWTWRILSTNADGDYAGRTVRGECKAKLSNRDDNRFRAWTEALINQEIPVGMRIDTDDLIGLSADVVIGIEPDRKDPLKKWNRVTDVIPATSRPGPAGPRGAFQSAEPPF